MKQLKIASFSPTSVLVTLFSLISSTAAGDSGDDLSNNFATDIAPLLALFGEQVAKQYLSDSLGLLDSIIFALAPLGIITAIISAIRVRGPSWLKSIIGRAREPRAAVEVELSTSTSTDVCELWNGIALLEELGQVKSDIYSFKDAFDEQVIVPKSMDEHQYDKFVKAPPNLSLNIGGERSSQGFLLLVTFIGVILQVSVVVLAGLQTYLSPWNTSFKKNGRAVGPHAFPLMVIGTFLLAIGMFICAHVIESNSVEEEWVSAGREKSFNIAWIQQGGVVDDQKFDSYFFFNKKIKLRKSVLKKDGVDSLVFVAMASSLVGFIVQFSALPIAIMAVLRAIIRRNLGQKPAVESIPDGFELEWTSKRLKDCELWELLPLALDSSSKKAESLSNAKKPGLGAEAVNARTQLWDMYHWDGKSQITAESLTTALENLINTWFSDEDYLKDPSQWTNKSEFSWILTIGTKGSALPYSTEDLTCKMTRKRYEYGRWSKWKANASQINAIIGLWLHNQDPLGLKDYEKEETVYLLSSLNKSEDFRIWLPRDCDYGVRSDDEALNLDIPATDVFKFETQIEDETTDVYIKFEIHLHRLCAQLLYTMFLRQAAQHLKPINDVVVANTSDIEKYEGIRLN
ncbi:MAG: hypothetical protein M1814_003527 [Vezdaea aestivalis]|nr:MAG: hypothetical protein M1814_003527 [Vezdaea aestivalis]